MIRSALIISGFIYIITPPFWWGNSDIKIIMSIIAFFIYIMITGLFNILSDKLNNNKYYDIGKLIAYILILSISNMVSMTIIKYNAIAGYTEGMLVYVILSIIAIVIHIILVIVLLYNGKNIIKMIKDMHNKLA